MSSGVPIRSSLIAHHIIDLAQDRVVGCARIILNANGQPRPVEPTIGYDRFETILRDIGITLGGSTKFVRSMDPLASKTQ